MSDRMPLRFPAAPYLFGGIALALVTLACVQLKLNAPTAAFCYLILGALVSVSGNIVASIVLSIAAAACLNYFFVPPTFSFGIANLSDAELAMGFLAAALVINVAVARSIGRARVAVSERQTLEQALRENRAIEERFRFIINQIPAHAWSATPDGNVDFVNDRWVDYTGLSLEEAKGWGWRIASHPDDMDFKTRRWSEILASGEAGEYEARQRRVDGQSRWFLFRVVPLRNERGDIVKWYGMNIDIDDRKRADERIRRSEQELRALVNAIPGLVWGARLDGSAEYLNQRWLDYTGLTADEALGWGWTATIHPDDAAKLATDWQAILESEKSGEAEARMRRHDGAYRWFLFRAEPVHDDDGNIERWYGANIDIEHRKQMEEKLRRGEAQLADAQRLSRTGSLIFIPATQELNWSEETARIYGYETSIKPTLDLIFQRIHPEDVASTREQVELAINGLDSFDFKHRLLMPDGSVKYLHVLAHGAINDSGQREIAGALTDVTATKHAEDALRRSEAYLAEAQRLSRVGSFGWTPSTGDIHWSEESYRIFGIEPGVKPTLELIRQQIHPDDREFVRQAIEQVSQGGRDFDMTHRLLMPNGAVKYVHILSHAVRDASGRMEVVGALMDITAAKHAEDALRRSEAFLAEAQRLSRVGSFGWTPSTGETHWSDQSYRIFEIDRSVTPTVELVMQHVHPDDVALVRQWFDLASAGEQDLEMMHRLLMRDGSVKYVQVLSHAIRNGSGKLEIVGAIMDITAARRTEEALRENEQRFRDYAETASDWLWESGPDHRFTQISVRLKAAGVDPTSAVGMTRWEAASGIEEEPEKWRRHQATLDAHLPFRGFNYRISRGDRTTLYVSTSGKPKFDAEGNFLGYRGVGTDTTASVRAEQAEQALQKSQAELAHVTRVTTLGELTASIAHEVNQPLAAIVANGDACLRWLGREPPNIGKARDSVESMISDGNRASQVVSRIRGLSKHSSPHKAPVNVNEIIDEVVLLVQREVTSSNVSVRLALAPEVPAVLGDRVQLQQVLINLVINGIQAMAPIVDRPRELTICSRPFDTADQVLVAVSDSGIGIDPDTANRLFDAFFTTKSGGLGMGLSICRSIVEAHGGRVWACANEGPGATFQFTLNASQEAAS